MHELPDVISAWIVLLTRALEHVGIQPSAVIFFEAEPATPLIVTFSSPCPNATGVGSPVYAGDSFIFQSARSMPASAKFKANSFSIDLLPKFLKRETWVKAVTVKIELMAINSRTKAITWAFLKFRFKLILDFIFYVI